MTKDTHFVCLDPRKRKRKAIADTLRSGGTIHWRRLAPMSLRRWPETRQEALTALQMSKDRDRLWVIRWLNLQVLKLQYNGARAYFAKRRGAVAVCWNGLNGTRRVFMQGAKHAGARRLFFELAPFPGRITVDPSGVNFANSLPRDIAPYLAWKTTAPNVDWRRMRSQIQQRQALTSTNSDAALPALTDPFLFVPLQTPGDSQLRLFGGEFTTVERFIAALSEAAKHLPDGWHLRIKEHPTAPTSFAAMIRAAAPHRIYLDNGNDTFAQVAASRGVVTVNSSVGLEAMFFDKPVIACGQCFWAIDGVAQTAANLPSLKKAFQDANTLTLEPESRDAFLSFLDQCYYPDRDDVDFAIIADRLGGKDTFGFWDASS